MRIWKYELEIADKQTILMPRGATVLSVAAQGSCLMLWAMVDEKSTGTDAAKFRIFGTGNPMGDRHPGVFIGTVVIGSYVWHVFLAK